MPAPEPTDQQVATWFRPTLSDGERETLRSLIGRVDVVLRGRGLDYVMYGGTLLGTCTHQDLLPWDDDADLLVLTPIHPAALLDVLAAALPDLRVVSHAGQVKVSGPARGLPWGFPFVDVGLMYPRGGTWCHDSMWGGVDRFPAAEVLPTRRSRLGSVEVNVPNDAAAVCRRKYGSECLRAALPPAYDHRTERPTGHPSVRVPLGRIAQVFRNPPVPPVPPVPASLAVGSRRCVALVLSAQAIGPAFELALAELGRRGVPVRRPREAIAPSTFRDRAVADALAAGFDELLLLDPTVAFDPGAVDRLRGHGLPFACGVYPASGRRGLVCKFAPGTTTVRLGAGGGVLPVVACGLGFALVRREVFDTVAASSMAPTYFATPGATTAEDEDAAFCVRAAAVGFVPSVDTSIRLWRAGLTRLGWEDAGGDRPRTASFTLRLPGAPRIVAPADSRSEPVHNALREPARSLPPGFPRLRLYLTSDRGDSGTDVTLASVRASDWGAEPVVLTAPSDKAENRTSEGRGFKRVLKAARADGCDFALVLGDQVQVCRNLRHNLLTNPLVRRDQCDFLSLFVSDLLADPWDRAEAHLGYRLAALRRAKVNGRQEQNPVRGLLLSARLVRTLLDRWDQFHEGPDARVLSACAELQVPLWYTAPCLIDRAPVGVELTPSIAYAPDFDSEFQLEPGSGFQPPEEVPGRLTWSEAELLWRTVAGRVVVELGTGSGRSTVCLGQSARQTVSVGREDQAEAMEWVRRFGVTDRVVFRNGDVATVCRELIGPFDLALVGSSRDASSLEREISAALPLLVPGGLLAIQGYPNPEWPGVRQVVDSRARAGGWKRVAQTGFLGIFRT